MECGMNINGTINDKHRFSVFGDTAEVYLGIERIVGEDNTLYYPLNAEVQKRKENKNVN